jgi:hypothetical protein
MNFRLFLENDKGFTHVYHVSPDPNIHKFRATGGNSGIQAVPQKQAGLYVAPSSKDAIAWATSYVLHRRKPTSYNSLTVYTIKVPKSIIKNAWYNSSWEKEFFIPEQQMDQLEIVARKTYTKDEFYDAGARTDGKRVELAHTKTKRDAEKLRLTNLAAKEYLRLSDKVSNESLTGKLARIDQIRELLKKLKSYLYEPKDWFEETLVSRLTPEKEQEVMNLSSDIEDLMKIKALGERNKPLKYLRKLD